MKKLKTKKLQQNRALPWFGADTSVCEHYAALLDECRHVTIPFCGGGAILSPLSKTAGEIVVSDKHALAMNFYHCLKSPGTRSILVDDLEATPFHEEVLRESQDVCKRIGEQGWIEMTPREVAFHYFITCWMGRSGKAGTESEFSGGLAMRWDAGGGSSPLRFRSAARSLHEVWGPICERCSFLCRSWEAIVGDVNDSQSCGIYCDPPWPGLGDSYRHKFTEQDHRDLRNALEFNAARVVIRYGDHPFIRDLYGNQNDWFIEEITSRNQSNSAIKELCITNWKPDHL